MEENTFQGNIRSSYTESEPWWLPKQDRSSKPNVLYILLDDTGFGDIGVYGSLFDTPNIDALAADGLQYTDFHANAMCSPTRASLLTGCNHHSCGMGYIAEMDLGFPNLRGQVGHDYGLISETLKEKGYNTFAVGKWHLVCPEYQTPAGPFDQWPLGRGFEKYYGFLPAEESQYYPSLVNGNEYVDIPKTPEEGYHLTEDLVDHAIGYIAQTKSFKPDNPFFCYLALGAHHSPLHAPKEYVDRYSGRFDDGWDVCRTNIFQRQKDLGLFPQDTPLPPNDYLVGDWDSCSDEQKKILARYEEVYGGFVSHTDAQIGRLFDYLKKIGEYNNTIIVFLSDNGASPEGGRWGLKNTMYHVFMEKDGPWATTEEAEKFGSPELGIQYPTAWAHVCNTPFRMYKTWNYAGGMRVPCIISYPNGIGDKGSRRSQYHHVVDINATILDVLGFSSPEEINGVAQQAKHGISMAYTFDCANARRKRSMQYYELAGNRALWSDGWKAVADHTENPTFNFSNDVWELYNTDEDPTETSNLADQYPEILKELVDMWWREAGKYNVLPMFESLMKKREGFVTRDIMKLAPGEIRKHACYYPECGLSTGLRIQNHSFRVRVYMNYMPGDEGVLFACGDNMGGYAMFVEDGKLNFFYDFVSDSQYHIISDFALPEGNLVVGMDFTKQDFENGDCQLIINEQPAGVIHIWAHPLFSEHGHMFAVGRFSTVSVAKAYMDKGKWSYSGPIERVEFDLTDIDATSNLENLEARAREATIDD